MSVVEQDRLIREARGYADLTVGHGMHISISGELLRALLDRIDHPATTPPPEPVTPPQTWQTALSPVLRIVADLIEDPAYKDLTGTNLVDALQAWAARNHTTLDPASLAAVDRALSGQ